MALSGIETAKFRLVSQCLFQLRLTNFMCRLSRNLGTSTFWNPKGLSMPVMGLLYLLLTGEYCVYIYIYYLNLSSWIRSLLAHMLILL
jgi:hypothetical protein